MTDDDRVARSTDASRLSDAVARLARWELAGGVWRVLGRSDDQVTIGLYTCDAGEEMERFTSYDEQLLAVIDERGDSEVDS